MIDKLRHKLATLAFDVWSNHAAELFATLILLGLLAYLAVFH
jgi:hypothetical protein